MIRVAVFGAPVARPMDFAEALMATGFPVARQESEEGPYRAYVVESDDVRLMVAAPPRTGVRATCDALLASCDVAILLVGAGAWGEQSEAIDAFESAHAARPVPLVRVVNEFVPPRAQRDLPAGRFDDALRGRLCWWRHEKRGAELARRALVLALTSARPP